MCVCELLSWSVWCVCVCVCVTMSIALGQTTPGTNTFGPPLGHDDPTGVWSCANKIAETDLVVGSRDPAFSRQGPQGPGPIGGVLRVDRVREKVKIDST